MAKPKILISLLTDAETNQAFCAALLTVFFERAMIAPEFIGHYEPINNVVNDVHGALEYCGKDFFWLRKHSIASQGALFRTTEHAAGSITLDASFDATYDWLSLFRDIVNVGNAYYGYLHLVTDEEWEKTRLCQEDASTFRSGAFAKKLEHGIMDLGWANYFGARWKPSINPVKLSNNCARLEHVEDGLLFTVTDDISDVKTNYDIFERKRQAAKAAFNEGFFRPAAG